MIVVSICAALISVASLAVAIFALRTARSAHALNARRDSEERARRDAAQLERARLVTLDVSFMGAPAAHVVNGSSDPITEARIESVECVSRPDLSVEPNRNVRGCRSQWDRVGPGEKRTFPVILVDADGHRDDLAGLNGADTWRVVCTFTDSDGQSWRRTGGSDPERIRRGAGSA